ncbi:hypothetical protein ACNOYE_26995 [Nannocystaceae bacterium ST9]
MDVRYDYFRCLSELGLARDRSLPALLSLALRQAHSDTGTSLRRALRVTRDELRGLDSTSCSSQVFADPATFLVLEIMLMGFAGTLVHEPHPAWLQQTYLGHRFKSLARELWAPPADSAAETYLARLGEDDGSQAFVACIDAGRWPSYETSQTLLEWLDRPWHTGELDAPELRWLLASTVLLRQLATGGLAGLFLAFMSAATHRTRKLVLAGSSGRHGALDTFSLDVVTPMLRPAKLVAPIAETRSRRHRSRVAVLSSKAFHSLELAAWVGRHRHELSELSRYMA